MEAVPLPYSSLDHLYEAVRFGYLEDVERQLHDIRTSNPTRPLSKFSHTLAEAIRYQHVEISLFLLLEQIPITPEVVHAAAKSRSREALSMLFDHGWDINQPLGSNEPPVLSKVLDDVELVAWLLEQGADPNVGCDIDETPLSYAVATAPIQTVQLLIEKAAGLEKGQLVHCAVDRDPPCLELINMLAENGAPCDEILWQDSLSFRYRGHLTRGTPLQRACKKDNIAVARVLLSLGADPDKLSMKDNDRVPPTAREIAQERGHPDMVMLFGSYELVIGQSLATRAERSVTTQA